VPAAEYPGLLHRKNWKDLTMIGVVESEHHEGEKISIERRYFISSLTTSADDFINSVQSHWSVENSLHWVLDIGFREDECRIRKGFGPEIVISVAEVCLLMLHLYCEPALILI
jgi:predicted transposase YbfD/YdcC